MSNKSVALTAELCEKIRGGSAKPNMPVKIIEVGGQEVLCEDKFAQLTGVIRVGERLVLDDFEISGVTE